MGLKYFSYFNSPGDLLENYCWDDLLMNISRLFFCFVILLTYPIECFVCREVLNNIFWKDNKVQTKYNLWWSDHSFIDKDSGWFRHVSVTVGLVMASCLVSMSTDCLGIVLELNVSTFLYMSGYSQTHGEKQRSVAKLRNTVCLFV